MGNPSGNVANRTAWPRDGARELLPLWLALLILISGRPAVAQERMYFPAIENVQVAIVDKINREQVRVDVAVWYFQDRGITMALINKFRSGVPVRVIGDRVALFEIDPITRGEFELLAREGIPIRLRYHPTGFPEIMHWKCGIFVGQNTVEFGSANWTPFELAPWSSTDFKDETALFSDDLALVRGFLTKFDQMWVDTTHFLDWPQAYLLETGQRWTTPMAISRARLEPDYPSPPGMIWGQGPELNNAMAAEIDREPNAIEMVIYRLGDPVITDALIRRRQAGVPVRIFIEPHQYREPTWPEYWLTGANVDRLWAAGAQIKVRTHAGLTHMKSLITSNVALNGSSNFTRNWQRDHNYFIPAAAKPSLHRAMRDRFNAMWNDSRNYAPFSPQPPEEPSLARPAGAARVSTRPTLEWNRSRWAVAFDVYLGTSPGALTFRGRVSAHLHENPPSTYSWTPGLALQGNTTYYWQIVARTFATDLQPALVARSEVRTFSTGTPADPSPPQGGLQPSGPQFDSDGVADVAVWRPGDGVWHIRASSRNGAPLSYQWGNGALNDVPVPGDYDGDGLADLAVWRPDGMWYVRTSSTAYRDHFAIAWGTGILGDLPVPGDYDGDGRTDLAVWRPGDGVWYILTSSSGYRHMLAIAWGTGALNDVPVPGDYDGDGRTDLAVWRPAEGMWYVLTSSSGYRSLFMHQWGSGLQDDVPVPVDYDGDGRTDIAIWRPSDGVWYIRTSRTGYREFFLVQWGVGHLGDIAVPADYDGDGRADIAIWRPGEGRWYIRLSSTGYATPSSVQWGIPGDVPLSGLPPRVRR